MWCRVECLSDGEKLLAMSDTWPVEPPKSNLTRWITRRASWNFWNFIQREFHEKCLLELILKREPPYWFFIDWIILPEKSVRLRNPREHLQYFYSEVYLVKQLSRPQFDGLLDPCDFNTLLNIFFQSRTRLGSYWHLPPPSRTKTKDLFINLRFCSLCISCTSSLQVSAHLCSCWLSFITRSVAGNNLRSLMEAGEPEVTVSRSGATRTLFRPPRVPLFSAGVSPVTWHIKLYSSTVANESTSVAARKDGPTARKMPFKLGWRLSEPWVTLSQPDVPVFLASKWPGLAVRRYGSILAASEKWRRRGMLPVL